MLLRASLRSVVRQRRFGGPCGPLTTGAKARVRFVSNGSAAEDALRRDFMRWAQREVGILSGLLVIGLMGVYFYRNRENAPSHRVQRLIATASQHAKQGDKEEAFKCTSHAYSITKATNPQDRHLFQLAFSLGAQMDTLERPQRAVQFYLEALDAITFLAKDSSQDVKRIVTCDRIAQCYQDLGEQEAAEKYYKKALGIYSVQRNSCEPDVEKEAASVMFNYGQQLAHLNRPEQARIVLTQALALVTKHAFGPDHVHQVHQMLTTLD